MDGHPRHDRLLRQVSGRIREELAKLEVEVNEEKSRTVDLEKGESFGYLGFDIRRVRSRPGRWWVPLTTPKLKKRTDLLERLKVVFRSLRSPAGGAGDRVDQPDSPGVGQLLRPRQRKRLLLLRPRLG